jgi:CO/xanthine dehydrogenase FAD-binding subunit
LDGGERRLPVLDFVQGPTQNALRSGELLRTIELPREALTRRTAFRRISLTPLGRSGALLIGTLSVASGFTLTVTASTRRPVWLAFAGIPNKTTLEERLAAEIPSSLYYDDIHGRPDWRRHMTFEFAEEIRSELSEGRA